MVFDEARDLYKKMRYMRTFLAGRLVHTNLQITSRCNFKCQICDFWREEQRSDRDLTTDVVRVISEKLNQIGPQIVSIGGGEPLLNRDVVSMVGVLSKHHFPVMICNGWYVTPQNSRALFRAGMSEISVSVDYADPKKHDAQRGREGAYDRAIEALSILHRSRTNRNQRVNMISVIMDDNLDEVEPLIQICERLGFTYLVTLYSDRRGHKDKRPIPVDVSRHLLALKQKYKHFVALRGYLARFSEGTTEGGIGPCFTGKHLCNIDSTGDVSLCIDRVDEPVGNILTEDMKTIEERLLQRHRSNTCTDCWTSCRDSIESIRYGEAPHENLFDYYQMTKPISINADFS
jgi:MoaA/NifB/PqqE/SkfB family radical SAM enzyme